MDETMKNRAVRRAVLAARVLACLVAVALYRTPVQVFLAYCLQACGETGDGRRESPVFSHADAFTGRVLYSGEKAGKKMPLRDASGRLRENMPAKSGI